MTPRTFFSPGFFKAVIQINLKRIQWMILAGWGLNVATFLTNELLPSLRNPRYHNAELLDIFVQIGLGALLWAVRRPSVSLGLKWNFILFFAVQHLLRGILLYGYLAERADNIAYGYAILIVSILLLLPGRTFLVIATASYLLYVPMIFLKFGHQRETMMAVVTSFCILSFGCVASWFLFQTKKSDFEKQEIIEKQKRDLQDLMTIAAHDLRSPLYGLRNLLEALNPRSLSEYRPPIETALAQARESCGRMLTLINRLLDLNSNRYQPQVVLKIHDFRHLLRETVRRTNPMSLAKSIGFTLDLPPDPALVRTDPNFLDQILDNLVYNAIRHSPSGSKITVALVLRDEHWQAEIQDEGPGIAETHRSLLASNGFPHTQSHSEVKSHGFGLFIVKHLLQQLGGALTYRDRVPNGAILQVSLPQATHSSS